MDSEHKWPNLLQNLVDASLPGKFCDCLPDPVARKLLDDLLQCRVFLSHDLFQPDRHHARILKLRKQSPGLYGLTLPPAADQQDTIIGLEPVHEVTRLPSRCKRRFIQHIKMLFAGIWLLAACQLPLQRGCFQARFEELLRRARAARCRSRY
jgi:hypothetical protein